MRSFFSFSALLVSLVALFLVLDIWDDIRREKGRERCEQVKGTVIEGPTGAFRGCLR